MIVQNTIHLWRMPRSLPCKPRALSGSGQWRVLINTNLCHLTIISYSILHRFFIEALDNSLYFSKLRWHLQPKSDPWLTFCGAAADHPLVDLRQLPRQNHYFFIFGAPVKPVCVFIYRVRNIHFIPSFYSIAQAVFKVAPVLDDSDMS